MPRRNLLVLFLNLFLVPLVSMGNVAFRRASGERDKSEGIKEMPNRMEVFSCVGKCKATPLCLCLRVSRKGKCEYFTNKIQPSDFALDGYVYYVAENANDSVPTDNLALKKPVHQSSVYSSGGVSYTPNLAVDGVRIPSNLNSAYFSHTSDASNHEKFPWWQVDLEEEYLIVSVRLLNRQNWAHRLQNFQIRVGQVKLDNTWDNKEFEENALCIFHPGGRIGDLEEKKLFCNPCPVYGRFVSVQIVDFCKDCKEPNSNVLQLAEVDVYGKKMNTVSSK